MTTLRSRRVVLEEGIRPATVRVERGVVVSIGGGLADEDFGDLVVLPGLVDSHVHVNEPGRAEWEGFATATAAAAAGGTTTIVDMPLNSIPPTTTVAALVEKRAVASGRLTVDVAFWGGIVPGTESEVGALLDSGVCGFKVFLTDSGVPEFPPVEVSTLMDLDPGLPLLVHAESDQHLTAPGPTYSEYLDSRPPIAEAEAIAALAGAPGPLHILHVSSAEGVAQIDANDQMTGETCPHYLTFTDDDVTSPLFKCAPPIRGVNHREALWSGLLSGALGMVVSDHSPSPPELKSGDFATAWGGIASLELRLHVTWTGAAARGIGLGSVAEWLAGAPARLAGLDDRKGTIAVGKDGDFVIFDPDGMTPVRGKDLFQRHKSTPYEGMALRGAVKRTVLGGDAVFDGRIVGAPRGRMLERR